jgi:hypothetical protein
VMPISMPPTFMLLSFMSLNFLPRSSLNQRDDAHTDGGEHDSCQQSRAC